MELVIYDQKYEFNNIFIRAQTCICNDNKRHGFVFLLVYNSHYCSVPYYGDYKLVFATFRPWFLRFHFYFEYLCLFGVCKKKAIMFNTSKFCVLCENVGRCCGVFQLGVV